MPLIRQHIDGLLPDCLSRKWPPLKLSLMSRAGWPPPPQPTRGAVLVPSRLSHWRHLPRGSPHRTSGIFLNQLLLTLLRSIMAHVKMSNVSGFWKSIGTCMISDQKPLGFSLS
ncbi:uncharacterized protein VTP21DRAFT_131 [Calcarisporiella thermophila]|uniref:uncharacterized protein n=1 Tax=Calcarisporiella thermophila TaxID=911321 RepID=UPI00374433A9